MYKKNFLEAVGEGAIIGAIVGITVFFIIIGIIVIVTKAKNSKCPIETAHIKILSVKKAALLPLYGVTVEFDSGERKVLDADVKTCMLLLENDVGEITYQGSKLIQFKRETS